MRKYIYIYVNPTINLLRPYEDITQKRSVVSSDKFLGSSANTSAGTWPLVLEYREEMIVTGYVGCDVGQADTRLIGGVEKLTAKSGENSRPQIPRLAAKW
jgi:hypothetical protein